MSRPSTPSLAQPISSGEQAFAEGVSHNRSSSNIGASNGGPMSKVGGNIELGILGEGKDMPCLGQSDGGVGSFFAPINSTACLNKDLVQIGSAILAHQSGGEFELADAGFYKTGQGITAPLNTHAQTFKDGLGAGFGKSGEGRE